MGWYSTWGARRKDIIDEVTKTSKYNGVTNECINKCFKGNNLWTLWKMTKDGESKTFICLFLLGKMGEDWGYKPIDEFMGPHDIECPINYIIKSDRRKNTERYAFNFRKRAVIHAVTKFQRKHNGNNPKWIKNPNIQYYLHTDVR